MKQMQQSTPDPYPPILQLLKPPSTKPAWIWLNFYLKRARNVNKFNKWEN